MRPIRADTREEAVDARRVDDVPFLGGGDGVEEDPRAVVDPSPADGEAAVPRLPRVGEQAASTAQTGVVEQQVDMVGVVRREHLVAKDHDRRLVADVADVARYADVRCRCGRARQRDGLGHVVDREITDRDVTALGGELHGEFATHPVAAPGDHGDLSSEVFHGRRTYRPRGSRLPSGTRNRQGVSTALEMPMRGPITGLAGGSVPSCTSVTTAPAASRSIPL